jgi:hypothetical protein
MSLRFATTRQENVPSAPSLPRTRNPSGEQSQTDRSDRPS